MNPSFFILEKKMRGFTDKYVEAVIRKVLNGSMTVKGASVRLLCSFVGMNNPIRIQGALVDAH